MSQLINKQMIEALEAGLEAMEFIVCDRMPMGEGDNYNRKEMFTKGANYMNGLETTFVTKAQAALAAAKGK